MRSTKCEVRGAKVQDVRRHIEPELLDLDDQAELLRHFGTVRSMIDHIQGHTRALIAMTKCGNCRLREDLIDAEMEKLCALVRAWERSKGGARKVA